MKVVISLCSLLVAISCVGQNQTVLPAEVRSNIEKRILFEESPGIIVGVVDRKGPRYYSFGKTAVNGKPVNEHTVYEIGSITKVFTAILLAEQVLDGKMRLDDPVQKYLPMVTIPKRNGAEITLGNLSDHTSGLPRMPSNFAPKDPANPFADYTVGQLYSFLSGYELTRDIGSAYEYSNLAQGLLGDVLSVSAGKSYEDLMLKRIASRLKMYETRITLDETMQENLATGHSNYAAVKNWDIPTLAGAGAIRSSAHDMLIFLSANLGLTKTSLRKAMDLTHKVRHDKAGDMRVGLAWHIAKGKHGDVIWHNGGTGGYRTFAGFVKETSTGVVVLTNSTAGADDIGFHLLNPDAPLKTPRPSIIPAIRQEIDSKGVEAGLVLYDQLKKTDANYDFGEAVLNTLGYSYIASNVQAALALLKLNMTLFPESSNVYDSYAEALLKNDEKDKAIEYYVKSVEINPGNTGGLEALKKLGISIRPHIAMVAEDILQSYVGVYELVPGFSIEITREGTHLFAQATNQPKFEVFAKTENEFYLKVVTASITFNRTNDVVESLTLHQNGQDVEGKRVE